MVACRLWHRTATNGYGGKNWKPKRQKTTPMLNSVQQQFATTKLICSWLHLLSSSCSLCAPIRLGSTVLTANHKAFFQSVALLPGFPPPFASFRHSVPLEFARLMMVNKRFQVINSCKWSRPFRTGWQICLISVVLQQQLSACSVNWFTYSVCSVDAGGECFKYKGSSGCAHPLCTRVNKMHSAAICKFGV